MNNQDNYPKENVNSIIGNSNILQNILNSLTYSKSQTFCYNSKYLSDIMPRKNLA